MLLYRFIVVLCIAHSTFSDFQACYEKYRVPWMAWVPFRAFRAANRIFRDVVSTILRFRRKNSFGDALGRERKRDYAVDTVTNGGRLCRLTPASFQCTTEKVSAPYRLGLYHLTGQNTIDCRKRCARQANEVRIPGEQPNCRALSDTPPRRERKQMLASGRSRYSKPKNDARYSSSRICTWTSHNY